MQTAFGCLAKPGQLPGRFVSCLDLQNWSQARFVRSNLSSRPFVLYSHKELAANGQERAKRGEGLIETFPHFIASGLPWISGKARAGDCGSRTTASSFSARLWGWMSGLVVQDCASQDQLRIGCSGAMNLEPEGTFRSPKQAPKSH